MGALLRECRHAGRNDIVQALAAYKTVSADDGVFSVGVEGDDAYGLLTDSDADAFITAYLFPVKLRFEAVRTDRSECERRDAIARLTALSGGKLIIKD